MDSQTTHTNIFRTPNSDQSSLLPSHMADLPVQSLTEQKYNMLLKQWIQQQEQRKIKKRNTLETSQIKVNKNKMKKSYGDGKKQNYVAINGNCEICHNQIINVMRGNCCRVCNREFCEQCMGRMRLIEQENKQYWQQKLQPESVPTCLSCDKNYLTSMIQIQFDKQIKPKIEQFNILQETKQQKHESDIKSNSSQPTLCPKQSIKQMQQKIIALKHRNKSLQKQNIQIHRKISWGEEVHQNLKQKLLKNRRKYQKSLSSQSIVTQGLGIKPPCAYESETGLSQKNALNDSVIGSIIEEQTRLVDRTKCCAACTIM